MIDGRIDSLQQDTRSALRGLRHRPWIAAAAIGMLALAVGISAAMFTIVDALLLHPVPFPTADQLGVLQVISKTGGPVGGQPATIRAWRDTHAFAAVEAARTITAVVGTDVGELTLPVAQVTPGVFQMLGGVHLVAGRMFDATEGGAGTDDRALISADLWRTRYGSDPAFVGRTITIDGQPVRIVGILPADFRFPSWNTQIWRVRSVDNPGNQWNTWPFVYVRLSPKVPRADALTIATRAAIDAGISATELSARIDSLGADGLDEYYARAVPLLSGGVVLLFLVLCANVSSLLLASLTARGRELATRAALGASRARLIRQAFIESALIGAFGLIAGVGLAWALVSGARAILPDAALLHSLNPLNLDWRALLVGSAAGLVATLGAGVIPAVIGTRVDASRALQAAGRASTETGRARVATRTLLACQIALSCLLLVGATALVRSFVNLMNADRGIDTRNVMVAWIHLPGESFKTPEARAAGARAIEEQARALPGVIHAAWSYGTPPEGAIGLTGDWIPENGTRVNMRANQSMVDPEFFALYGIPMLKGRTFEPSDTRDAVVVSERIARALWPGANPIGQTVSLDNQGSRPIQHFVLHVVGVAKDTHFPSLERDNDVPQLYSPYMSTFSTPMLSLRCGGPCPPSGLVMRKLIEAAPGARVQDIDLLERRYFAQLARPRLAAALAFAFAVTTLIAAAAGLFSLLSHAAARRRREFGIRSALGASPTAVRRLVWREGLTVTLAGIGLGTIAGISIARLISALLYDVTVADPLSWAIVAVVLLLTIAAASWLPARTAARTAPVTLLREE